MKRLFTVLLLGIFSINSLVLAGCLRNIAPTPQPQTREPTKKPAEYFPLTKGSYWQYQGEGNEFASFSREVLFTEGDRAQIKENNGGTVSAAVFKTTDSGVVRIFFQGEAYGETDFLDQEPNEKTFILKVPFEVGNKWEEPNGTREIVDVAATVDTPAGTFEDCIKVKISAQNSIIFEYFKNGVGMVQREFTSEESRVTSILEQFKINPDSAD